MAKGPDAFRTISEAADEVGVPQHVLRFWETKFTFIRPMKRAGGRRFYRPADVAVLRGVRVLLHDKGFTIKGAQKFYRENGAASLVALGGGETVALAEAPASATSNGAPAAGPAPAATPQGLEPILAELEAAKAALDKALAAR